MSLVELLVVLGIIALVASLVLPALGQAREAAQRAGCANNLRQLGMGCQSYLSSYSVFPAACGMPNYRRRESTPPITAMKQYSAFSQLLPYLDATALYSNLNFETALEDPYLFVPRARPLANETAISVALGVFFCPSDGGGGDPGWTGGVNYRVNLGVNTQPTLAGHPTNGAMTSYRCTTPASISDGLGNTIVFSEKLRGRSTTEVIPHPRTDMIVGGLSWPFTIEESLAACMARRGSPGGSYGPAGLTWAVGTLSQTCYNHIITPNSAVPDCVLPLSNPISGLIGARSNHPGMVHAAMADGSVRRVSNTVAREVWKAIGTRANGEVVQPDSL